MSYKVTEIIFPKNIKLQLSNKGDNLITEWTVFYTQLTIASHLKYEVIINITVLYYVTLEI